MYKITRRHHINPVLTISSPSDKSISHRALILLALANGRGTIYNLLESEDVLATLNILTCLGVGIEHRDGVYLVEGMNGVFHSPKELLDCGNSGTSIRLLLGLVAPHSLRCTFIGDASLSKRPMGRVTNILQSLGVIYEGSHDFCPITQISGKKVASFDVTIPLASAQVKSALLLTALQSEGGWVRGGKNSRDHTENMLKALGASLQVLTNGDVYVEPSELSAIDIHVPGDFSSAAFFIAAGLLLPNVQIHLKHIGLNPTRTGLLTVLCSMGANIEVMNERIECGERVGDLLVSSSMLKGITVSEALVPTMIDEFPILALIATQAHGTTSISGASDLRKKESDRIESTCNMIRTFGATIEEHDDGWTVNGPQQLSGGCVDPHKDHRLAMTAAIASCVTREPVEIVRPNVVRSSYPSFWEHLSAICTVEELND